MGRMKRGTEEERQRVRTDFSLAIGDIRCGGGHRVRSSVFTDLQEAEKELEADTELNFLFEWNIVDADESHIYVTNRKNSHRFHISVICPAALYVDVYRILDDGTEVDAFGKSFLNTSK